MAYFILMKEKKVAGILLDTSIQSNKIESIILGIGINFKINPHRLENNIKKCLKKFLMY